MIKNKEKRERRKKTVPIWIGILVFIGAFIIGILSKLLIQPSWMADYSMKWSDKAYWYFIWRRGIEQI